VPSDRFKPHEFITRRGSAVIAAPLAVARTAGGIDFTGRSDMKP
jgi:hypothetical protein